MPTVTDQARDATERSRELATEATTQATRLLQTALRDGALATVGAGDELVRRLRAVSDQVRHLDLRTEEGRHELEERLTQLRGNAAAEFEQLVERGREVVDGISHSRAAERAAGQAKVATSQVKTAATSFRKIADVGASQAAETVVGLRQAADRGAEQAAVAATEAKDAAAEVGEAADHAAEVVADSAERIGSEPDEVPLEDLKVVELRELAKQRDITGRAQMSKDELIAALRES